MEAGARANLGEQRKLAWNVNEMKNSCTESSQHFILCFFIFSFNFRHFDATFQFGVVLYLFV
jgi:hypothetical protein